jgi:hypothetical protein
MRREEASETFHLTRTSGAARLCAVPERRPTYQASRAAGGMGAVGGAGWSWRGAVLRGLRIPIAAVAVVDGGWSRRARSHGSRPGLHSIVTTNRAAAGRSQTPQQSGAPEVRRALPPRGAREDAGGVEDWPTTALKIGRPTPFAASLTLASVCSAPRGRSCNSLAGRREFRVRCSGVQGPSPAPSLTRFAELFLISDRSRRGTSSHVAIVLTQGLTEPLLGCTSKAPRSSSVGVRIQASAPASRFLPPPRAREWMVAVFGRAGRRRSKAWQWRRLPRENPGAGPARSSAAAD